MNTFRFVPEGWSEEIEKLDIQKYRNISKKIRQYKGLYKVVMRNMIYIFNWEMI